MTYKEYYTKTSDEITQDGTLSLTMKEMLTMMADNRWDDMQVDDRIKYIGLIDG
jgi:hypothetical protein